MKRKVALFALMFVLIPVLLYAQYGVQNVERVYDWFAEERLTVGSTVVQLSSEEYLYEYGATRITGTHVDANNAFVEEEVVTDGTTGAMGILKGYNSATSPTYLDILILYNGGDSADIDANDVLTGATNSAQFTVGATYTRGDRGPTFEAAAQIAEIFVLDNSLIFTLNGATPYYNATDASCIGTKQFELDKFYIFGSEAIQKFKAIRNSTSDCVIYVKYGR